MNLYEGRRGAFRNIQQEVFSGASMLKCGRCRGSSPTSIINISRYSWELCAREAEAAAVEALADLRGRASEVHPLMTEP